MEPSKILHLIDNKSSVTSDTSAAAVTGTVPSNPRACTHVHRVHGDIDEITAPIDVL